MHFSGIGAGNSHSSDIHRITECMHEHTHFKQEGASAAGGAANMSSQVQQMPEVQEGQLSLSAWVEKALGSGKRLLKGIWGTNETAAAGEIGDKTGAEQVMAQLSDMTNDVSRDTAGAGSHQPDASRIMAERMPGTPQIAAAATAVQNPQPIESNPYFAAVENIGGRQDTFWQKIKVKFKDVAGQLAGQLPRKFSGSLQTKNSFHAKQETPKQDLRKHSKFRRDEVEIDCVLTDDSYLMDSYDRKGEYSKLSTKK